MAKSGDEIFNEKVNLIYEFDKSSPLYIRRAFILMGNNKIEEAISVLSDGLKLYPYHIPARILYIKALILNNNIPRANAEISILEKEYLPVRLINYLKKEVERRDEPGYIPSSIKAFADLETPDLEKLNTDDLLPEFSTDLNIDDNLEKIAKDLTNAKMPRPEPEKREFEAPSVELPDENLIVSETMAKIYLTQGETKEAIKVYEKLLKKEPQKKEYYFQKIRELKSKLNS